MTNSITFKKHNDHGGPMTFTANWSDDKGRYHVWINEDGVPEDVIYMNPVVNADGSHKSRLDPGYFNTRKLDLNAKANSAAQRAITVGIAQGRLMRAAGERRAELDAAAGMLRAKLVEARRAQLQRIAAATGSSDLTDWLGWASDDVVAALSADCF